MCDQREEMKLHTFDIRPACQRGVILFPPTAKSTHTAIVLSLRQTIRFHFLAFLYRIFLRILDYTTLAKNTTCITIDYFGEFEGYSFICEKF